MVHLDKEHFIGNAALEQSRSSGGPRQFVGLEIDWTEVEKLYEKFGLTPAAPSQASRVAVPVYLRRKAGRQGDLHHVVADAEEDDRAGQRRRAHAKPGTRLQMEITVEAMRHR